MRGGGGALLPWMLLWLAESPSHGYELLERSGREGPTSRPPLPGSLYRWLRGLERQGLVCSRWEAGEAGPARRRYVLTDEGWALLEQVAQHLALERRRLDEWLDRYQRLRAGRPEGDGRQPPSSCAPERVTQER